MAQAPLPASTKVLVSVAQMREIERRADAAGHSFAAMMAQAGASMANEIMAQFGAVNTLVLCGPGNNGGDGLVCARKLHAAGVQTRVIVVGRSVAGSDADPLVKSAISEDVLVAEFRLDDLTQRQWLAEAQVVVDALLGTGSNRPIQGAMADLIGLLVGEARARRAAGGDQPTIVACDCPSGLNCDTGEVEPLTMPAALTCTFGFAKVGQFKFPGAQWCGRITIVPIGLPVEILDEVTQSHDRIFVVESAAVERVIPLRKLSAHKGSFGKVMVAAGSVPYPGAVTLACRAAGRVGAGLVTGAIPEPVWSVAAARLAEPTWLPFPAHDGAFDATAAEPLRAALAGYKALVLGCGMTQRSGARAFLEALLRPGDPALPAMVIDADALNILAQIPDWPVRLRACATNGVILTPHPAELARLLNLPLAEATANRWELARQAALRWGVVLLAKGPYTVVAHPTGQLAVVPHATPALSTAGTGDVLAGAIGGLLAQGLAPWEATYAGAWLHGYAGLLAGDEVGLAGTVAGDVAERLPAALTFLHRLNEPNPAAETDLAGWPPNTSPTA